MRHWVYHILNSDCFFVVRICVLLISRHFFWQSKNRVAAISSGATSEKFVRVNIGAILNTNIDQRFWPRLAFHFRFPIGRLIWPKQGLCTQSSWIRTPSTSYSWFSMFNTPNTPKCISIVVAREISLLLEANCYNLAMNQLLR